MLTDVEFCKYIERAPVSVRGAAIYHLAWWRDDTDQFRRHSLVITAAHQPADGPPVLYDLRVERVSKGPPGPAQFGAAEHNITITLHRPLKHYSSSEMSLIFALLCSGTAKPEERPVLFEDSEFEFGVDNPKFANMIHCFRDAADMDWRGPPGTLGHLAIYIRATLQATPFHTLQSRNCYYHLPVVLTHLIVHQHYSFTYLVSDNLTVIGCREVTHDPSTSSSLFCFLYEIELRVWNRDLVLSIIFRTLIPFLVFALFGIILYSIYFASGMIAIVSFTVCSVFMMMWQSMQWRAPDLISLKQEILTILRSLGASSL